MARHQHPLESNQKPVSRPAIILEPDHFVVTRLFTLPNLVSDLSTVKISPNIGITWIGQMRKPTFWA